MKLAKVAAGGFAVFALVGMTACSSDEETTSDADSSTTQEDAGSADTDAAATDSGPSDDGADEPGAPEDVSVADDPSNPGSIAVLVDGEQLAGFDGMAVSCGTSQGITLIGTIAGATGADQEFGAVVEDGDPPAATSVSVIDGSVTYAIAAQPGAGAGGVEVTVDGAEYVFTGTAQVLDLNNPTAMATAKIEVTVDCP